MTKLITYLFIIFCPLFTFGETSDWHNGLKSKLRLISSEQFIGIEIKLDNNYQIENQEKHIKFIVNRSDNLKDYKLIYPKPQYNTDGHNYYSNTIIFPVQITAQDSSKPVTLDVSISYPVCRDDCNLENFNIQYKLNPLDKDIDSETLIYEFLTGKHLSKNNSLFHICLIALLGGLILNLMPCVLPVLGIKLSILSKSWHNSRRMLNFNLIATSLGIIFSFLLIAFSVIFLKSIGEDFGYGFYFQNYNFIILITIILMIAASSILERIHLTCPNFISNSFIKFESKFEPGIILSFLTGCFTTLMATPCTAPFVTTAIGFALVGNNLDIICVFTFMGLGLALPYLLLIFMPNLIKLLPKSGNWMKLMKKLMAALVYLSVFWFIYILSNQLSDVAALVFFLILILLKFFLEAKINFYLKYSALLILLCGAFLLPNYANIEHLQKEHKIDNIWHNFEIDQIETQIKLNKIVIIDVTATWCGTCQLNKFMVLDSDYMVNKLQQNDIYAMRADVSSHFPPYLKDFMKQTGNFAIPYNIIYGPHAPHGIVLNPILTIPELNEAINKAK